MLEEQRGISALGVYYSEKYKTEKEEVNFIEARELFKDALDLAERLREEKVTDRKASFSIAQSY